MGRPGLTRHRKFLRLQQALGSALLARGSLELLWDVGYENGDDYLGDSGDVELAARWDGEPGKLTKALLDAGGDGRAGFIEQVEGSNGQYRIHDLFENAPQYVRRRYDREQERKKQGKTISDVRRDAALARYHQRHDDGANPVTQEQADATDRRLQTNGSHLQSGAVEHDANDATPAPAPAPKHKTFAHLVDERVLAIYRDYPRKVGKKAALKAIAKAIAEIATARARDRHGDVKRDKEAAAAWLQSRVAMYANSPAVTERDKQFIPYPSTWFNEGRYDDDEREWQHVGQQGNVNRTAGTNGSSSVQPLPASQRIKRELSEERVKPGSHASAGGRL